MRPKAMAELAEALRDGSMTLDEIRNIEHRPVMSDKHKRAFMDRVQNRDQAGLKVVKNQDKATIRIYDVIGWPFIMAEDVARALEDIDSEEIEVQINSPGGDAFDGIAIFNTLRSHDARVTTRVDGLAASAASIIAQAGDHRVMLTGSEMMVHEAWGITIGPEQDHLDNAAALNKLSRNMAGIYAERADGDTDGFFDLMKAETWLTADETVEAGLADEAVTPDRPPQDSAPDKFIDQLEGAIAALEEVTTRAEDVVTFRSDQGKSPLSEDAVAVLERAKVAVGKLTSVGKEETEKRLEELRARADQRREILAEARNTLEKLS